jgi:hypothetical protein
LDEHTLFGNVRDVDSKLALIQNIAEADVHPALRRKPDSGLLTYCTKLLAVIEIELRDTVIVGDE